MLDMLNFNDSTGKLTNLVTVLSKIPSSSWRTIVEKEPEYYCMQSFLGKFGFGKFSVVMVACGLNDFQLKGKAEFSYWPKIKALLESRTIATANDMTRVLHEFYSNERLSNLKNARLDTFMRSRLAQDLMNSTPQVASTQFIEYWHLLASAMKQTNEKKTIVFAMKCLGLALLMAGEYNFNFDPIPIPVDLRVRRLTEQLGFSARTDEEVRQFWRRVLSSLRENDPCVTMVHLDSFVWQIAGEYDVLEYFRKIRCPDVGRDFTGLINH